MNSKPNKARIIIEQVIQEMISINKNALNGGMADEASKRLGRTIDNKTISNVRNEMGLGSYQMHIREVVDKVRNDLHDFYRSSR